MSERVQTAAVLGAGVMGMGIAAHLAGAGIKTHLMDIVPRDLDPADKDNTAARNRLVTEAIQKALKTKPAPFFDPALADQIIPGNFEDHLDRLKECDLVVEVVVERLDIKKSLFAKVAPHLKDDAILASNTSGLSVEGMTADLPDDLKKRFIVMHFFNPVRYMHLLELVPGKHTSEATLERIADLGRFLGKGVVYAKDTTNFIGNRIGTYSMMAGFQLMEKMGLTIEQVDKIAGPALGRPRLGAFKLGDMVGIDVLAHVAKNCYDELTEDPFRDAFNLPSWVTKLVEQGNLGRKTGAGFYKKVGKDVLVLDIKTGEYRAQEKVRYDSLGAIRNIEDVKERIKTFLSCEDEAAQFAWTSVAATLCYSAMLIPEISDDFVQIDNAMRWGYNWDLGPFQIWDAIGVRESVARMQKDGMTVPKSVLDMLASGRETFYEGPLAQPTVFDLQAQKVVPQKRDPKAISLAALKEDKKNIVAHKLGATLIDLGDGVLCLEAHTKLNTIDEDVTRMLEEGVAIAEKDFEALVIGNQGQHFGAGANLLMIYMAAQQEQWDTIDLSIQTLQNALQGLRYAKVPVVAAPFQYTFGGCAEIVMASDAAQAHAETYMGLVEVGVGLIPGGGGCLRMVERWTEAAQNVPNADLLPFIAQGSLNIAMAKVATGAFEAKRFRLLSPTDGISLHAEHLLYEAKARALGLAHAGYRPPQPRVIKAGGEDMAKTIKQQVWGLVEGGQASEHDALIAGKVAHIVCGGSVAAGTKLTEQHYLDLEREAFLSLCGEEKTQARIQFMLMNNKPLRN